MKYDHLMDKIKIKLNKRTKILPITKRDFFDALAQILEKERPMHKHYEFVRLELSRHLSISSLDVDRLLYSLYYYSPTFRKHIWFYPDFTDRGSRILRRSNLQHFDKWIRQVYVNTRFGWDSIGWLGKSSREKELKDKMLEEWITKQQT